MSIGYRAASGNYLYTWGLIAVCVFIGYAAVQVTTKIAGEQAAAPAPAPAKSVAAPAAPISVDVIDGDTISLNDGRPNVRLVGFNAPETGSRARCETERQKGEAAKHRLANSSAMAALTSSRLPARVGRGQRAPMRATSVVAAARCA